MEKAFQVINGTSLSELCDYSFGDHMGGSNPSYVKGGFIKPANISNAEFLLKAQDFKGRVMSLFIDNIRLYNRPVEANAGSDAQWVSYLLMHNDLLALCAQLPETRFVIFTSHEDTPIDEHIRLPDNVLAVHATNAVFNNEHVIPFPYGLQRELGDEDRRIEIMKDHVLEDRGRLTDPSKLLYINCGLGAERNAGERAYLPNFEGKDWTTCRFNKDSKFFEYDEYHLFLAELMDHKFIICPQGHGIDCHRNWESLYLRRVPVMKDCQYFRRLMNGFPVLFVDDWYQVNESLLKAADYLFKEAQEMDLSTLDLNKIYAKIMAGYRTEL